MTRALALLRALAIAVALGLTCGLLLALAAPAHAAGNAPGPADPPGVPVVAVAEVLATIHPGDDMGVLLALFTPDYRPEDNRRCELDPCCPGCITAPIPPAPVPLPGTITAFALGLAGLGFVKGTKRC